MEKKVYHIRKKLKLISLRITHKDVYVHKYSKCNGAQRTKKIKGDN
jgi:hypothetical protein